ncbi:MAG: winged helix-turn-helix domain-containing protein [Thermoplasmataceae archaeon]
MGIYGDNLPDGLILKNERLIVDGNLWKIVKDYTLLGRSGLTYRFFACLVRDKPALSVPVCSIASEEEVFSKFGSLKAAMVDCGIPQAFAVLEEENLFSKYFTISLNLGIFPARSMRNLNSEIPATGISRDIQLFRRLKRDRVSMMADIMQFLHEESATITSIIYRCNLNYQTATELLNELLLKKYVTMMHNSRKPTYVLTRDGAIALESLKRFIGT